MSELHSRETEIGSVSSGLFALADAEQDRPINSGETFITSTGPRYFFRYRYIKRALDIFLILLSAPVLVPLVGVIAVAIRIGSPGPIFFLHRRIRRHGKFFTMWKFRTMCNNSTEVLENYLAANPEALVEWRETHKLKSDPRVTRVGEFLRKTSLDELPQLWNVLTDSMSLVGPRPIVAAEVEKYGAAFADYCLVKPGITGLWQVSGRSETTYEDRLKLDCQYIHNWSLRADIVILGKTLFAVVKQHGAY